MLEVDVFQIPGGRRTLRIDKSTIICGRSAKCDVVVRDPDVSRRHLRIELVNGELWAEDMGSSNGSTLEGEPLATRSRVGEGQVLRVCDHEIRVRILQSEGSVEYGSMSSGAHPSQHTGGHPAAAHPHSQHTAQTAHTGSGHPTEHAPHPSGAHAVDPSAHPQDARYSQTGYAGENTPPRQEFPQQQHAANQSYAEYGAPQAAYQLLVAPAPGRVDVPEDAPTSPRTFQCGEAMWQSYEHMAHEAGVPVDQLLNEALAMYGRRRVYADAGSASRPETSLQFTHSPPNELDFARMLVKPKAS